MFDAPTHPQPVYHSYRVSQTEELVVDAASEKRRKIDELVRRKYVEQCKYDKQQEQKARERVRDQIEGDRLMRQIKQM